ncbi:hypothetical protein BU14_0203s0005 [Porphyra umbilicalis]|uniref:Malonyl-CoA decarboxylase C-terminal domain-containing protein n=1 Tax=Porphyra umbilicalis TaxID=2786 RepID=A0A1X6P5S9_PORUM|nr:hypothetical protein BU14_0203s0005 [Porphyra umbilicalis]|eukprot:OSX76194.1 hypothetical protein BU14_0203s0005 [Porphyra umbilicalis]
MRRAAVTFPLRRAALELAAAAVSPSPLPGFAGAAATAGVAGGRAGGGWRAPPPRPSPRPADCVDGGGGGGGGPPPLVPSTPAHDAVCARVRALLRRVAAASASPTSTQPPLAATASRGRLPDDALSARLVGDIIGGYKLLPAGDRLGVLAVVAEDLRPVAADVRAAAGRLVAAMDAAEGAGAGVAAASASTGGGGGDGGDGGGGGASPTVSPSEASVLRERVRNAERAARIALSPSYTTLLTRLVSAPGGLAFLINLRADILSAPREALTPPLRAFCTEVTAALRMWLSAGSLSLSAVTPASPAALLQRLATVSAASSPQPVRSGMEGLYARLQHPRIRAYALMHAGMEGVPLVFVEVAYCSKMPATVEDVFADAPASAGGDDMHKMLDTLAFYSVVGCEAGLAGMELGGDVIRRVVAAELGVVGASGTLLGVKSAIRQVVTLSPMPGFAAYLRSQHLPPPPAGSRERPAFLHRHAARYLLHAKRRGGALDAVAHFHLRNGASVARVNADADASASREAESHGVMVNYRYVLGQADSNAGRYVRGIVVSTADVRAAAAVAEREVQAARAAAVSPSAEAVAVGAGGGGGGRPHRRRRRRQGRAQDRTVHRLSGGAGCRRHTPLPAGGRGRGDRCSFALTFLVPAGAAARQWVCLGGAGRGRPPVVAGGGRSRRRSRCRGDPTRITAAVRARAASPLGGRRVCGSTPPAAAAVGALAGPPRRAGRRRRWLAGRRPRRRASAARARTAGGGGRPRGRGRLAPWAAVQPRRGVGRVALCSLVAVLVSLLPCRPHGCPPHQRAQPPTPPSMAMGGGLAGTAASAPPTARDGAPQVPVADRLRPPPPRAADGAGAPPPPPLAALTPLAAALPALPPLAADAVVASASAAAAAAAVGVAAAARRGGALSGPAARKAVHFGTAPAFVATWGLYSPHPAARLVAAAVPVAFAIALAAAGRRRRGDASAGAGTRGGWSAVVVTAAAAAAAAAVGRHPPAAPRRRGPPPGRPTPWRRPSPARAPPLKPPAARSRTSSPSRSSASAGGGRASPGALRSACSSAATGRPRCSAAAGGAAPSGPASPPAAPPAGGGGENRRRHRRVCGGGALASVGILAELGLAGAVGGGGGPPACWLWASPARRPSCGRASMTM